MSDQNRKLPPRTTDTMSDAIALSSPSGRMSKRARKAAEDRLGRALFGEAGLQSEPTPQPTERDRMLAQAVRLRDLAARGMNRRAYNREADRLERLAGRA